MDLYLKCMYLIAQYPPIAVEQFAPGCTEMVFVTARECFLLVSHNEGVTVRRWNSPARVHVRPDGTVEECDGLTSAAAERAVGAALPVPRDGSLLAWTTDGTVTGLVVFYTREHEDVAPRFSPMPRADLPEGEWPPFTGEPVLGQWVWDHISAGRLVNIGPCLAGTRGAAWWLTAGQNDSGGKAGAIAVSREVHLSCGAILPRGLYAYHKTLRLGGVPSLEGALASRGKTDLGFRFRNAA